ncbi:glycoside hydrolase family 2 protein [Cryobacterium lactosi]|nr:glycoside hydrolase family 2 TIM barrel-domain containing protein [Cryobacterium lactosi]
MRNLDLSSGWSVLQDVHNSGEFFEIYNVAQFDATHAGSGISEWEPLEKLQHLQVALDPNPYWGRSLRHFNTAPWFYRLEFDLDEAAVPNAELRFSNVDYFGRVWLNGALLGDHEGYGTPFSFDVVDLLTPGRNVLVVKVWSPWDSSYADGSPEMRTLRINRDMAKGTYEHDDTLIPRDVNPVGIYGSVSLIVHDERQYLADTRVTARLDGANGVVTIAGNVMGENTEAQLTLRVRDMITGAIVTEQNRSVSGHFESEVVVAQPRLWSTWDHGDQGRYFVEAAIGDTFSDLGRVAFRTVSLKRTPLETSYRINDVPFYVRGTSYLPDAYLSTMTRERYLRDLRSMKNAGFNTVRVHVHIELPEFYDLCDELGLAVIQDTDYNWNHPTDKTWRERFIQVAHEMVLMLETHPCIITWVALNEPGNSAPTDEARDAAMSVSPGPQIIEALKTWDPTRPVIKGSWCVDDLESGDSHNYTGSLWAPDVSFTEIDGTTEKFNTEFGFDAPSSFAELTKYPDIAKRLSTISADIPELQEYQYTLTKYYIDHYRAQKDNPNSGYVQFMFIDVAPQSFYGVVSHAGLPKRGYDALFESNQPVSVFLRRTANEVSDVLLANDHPWSLGQMTVEWTVTNAEGATLSYGTELVDVGANSLETIASLGIKRDRYVGPITIVIVGADQEGRVISRSIYNDVFNHPRHPKGHPDRMSHELGVRLYGATS